MNSKKYIAMLILRDVAMAAGNIRTSLYAERKLNEMDQKNNARNN